ncbi:MAG: protein kinase [Anaerolineae bacterium]|nr:protein kinase [Anaerolineae bacterium]
MPASTVFAEPILIKGYEVLELIGQGGFGAVYRAMQPVLGREVAIKVILPEFANSDEFIRRFEAEAQLVARLEHPHIVPLFDYWREPDSAYLVMRFIRGGSLTDDLRQSGPWTPEATLKLLEQIGGALITAHRNQVVHRDIKPDNILLDEDHNAYLSDFGIARILGNQEVSDDGISGSLAYMAPEQLEGLDVTPRADVYSLALVLYEMLTGESVFGDTDPEHIITRRLYNVSYSPVSLTAELPEAIKSCLFRATFKDPEDRHADMREFIEDFRRSAAEAQIGIMLPDIDLSAISNPYKGLRPFEEADALDFFGRDALTSMLLDRLTDDSWAARFLAVVGPSGSGKSSVVKAGLVPALREGALEGSDQWFIAEMVPGAHPLRNLEAAILSVAQRPPTDLHTRLRLDSQALVYAVSRSIAGELLLVIDQFEETFLVCEDEEERQQFLNLVQRAVTTPDSRVRAVVTLRADYYDRPLLHKGFGGLIQTRTQVVLPMSAKEVEQAITGPANRVGLLIEPDLIASMIADISAEPGALPLLQYALTELFEQRDGFRLTALAYGQMGGVIGVLAKRAEEVYKSLDSTLQSLTRQIFLRLVSVNEGQPDTRRRVRRSELLSLLRGDSNTPIDAVLDAFGKYRLLTFDIDSATREPMVEIAHEALLHTWDTLQGWLETNRAAIRTQRLLANAAQEWVVNHRKRDFLLQGGRLVQFREWAQTTEIVLTPGEQEYLALSITEQERQDAVDAERKKREALLERRSRRGVRFLLVGMLAAALIMLLLAGSASSERQIAQDARATSDYSVTLAVAAQATADRRAQESNSIANAANALLLENSDPLLALPLAIAANRVEAPPAFAERALSEIAYAPRTISHLLEGHQRPIYGSAFSPDGKTLLTAAYDKTLILWDVTTGKPIRTLTGHQDGVTCVAFFPDGKRAISGSYDKTLIIWDVATGKPIKTLTGHAEGVVSVAVSADGKRVMSGGQDSLIIEWDVEQGNEKRAFSAQAGAINAIAINPANDRAVTAADDGTLAVWDMNKGDVEFILEGHTNVVNTVKISPDGKYTLSGSNDSTLILWDMATGNQVRTLRGHTDLVNAVAFAPDGKRALSGSFDQTVIEWDLATGTPLRKLVGHTGAVYTVAISHDGQLAFSGGTDITGLLWSLPRDHQGAFVRAFSGHGQWVNAVDLSGDGKTLISGASDGSVIMWDTSTGNILHKHEMKQTIFGAAFSPVPDANGHWLAATGGDDTVITLWDATTGEALRTFKGHSGPVNSLAFSPDGKLLISTSDDTTLMLWDVLTGKDVRTFKKHTDAVNSAVFLPDGKLAISASTDTSLLLWNIETGRAIRTFSGHTGPVWKVVVSADGRYALSASTDGTLIYWELSSGKAIRTLVGHNSIVWSAALSPDGQWAASGSDDKSIIIWDIASGQAIRTYQIDHVALSLRFGQANTVLYSGLDDDTVTEWRIDSLNDMINWTYANRIVRELSCAERITYAVQPPC